MAIPRPEFERVRRLVNEEIPQADLPHAVEILPGEWDLDITGRVDLRIDEIKQSIAYGTGTVRTGRPMLVLHVPYHEAKFRPRRASGRVDEELVRKALRESESMAKRYMERFRLDDPARLAAYNAGRQSAAALPEEEKRRFWMEWRQAAQDPHFSGLWSEAIEKDPEFWAQIAREIGGENPDLVAREYFTDGVSDEMSLWARLSGMPGLYPGIPGKAKEWSPREKLVE